MNCATFSASAPAITSMFPPTARDSSTSGGPRPCWPSCKPHDETSPHVREHRLYLLARVLTEPLLVDGTGLKLCGAGEWLIEKHGTRRRRSWRKMHIGVDADTGQI